ncbi:MAG: hypothetical protein AB8G99_10785, partial [Planctomycetaceae bacterium]
MKIETESSTAMQRVATGIAFAALICVALVLRTDWPEPATTPCDVVVSSEASAWFSESQFLTTEALEPNQRYSVANFVLLLTHPRAWYEASWPTYDDLPSVRPGSDRAEPMKFRQRPAVGRFGERANFTEYVGMAPVDESLRFWSSGAYDLETDY